MTVVALRHSSSDMLLQCEAACFTYQGNHSAITFLRSPLTVEVRYF